MHGNQIQIQKCENDILSRIKEEKKDAIKILDVSEDDLDELLKVII